MRYDAGEVITAMVTPMNQKREIDYNKVESLTHHLMNHGSDAVFAAEREVDGVGADGGSAHKAATAA